MEFISFPLKSPRVRSCITSTNSKVLLISLENDAAAIKITHVSSPAFWAFFCDFFCLCRWWTFCSFKNCYLAFTDNAEIYWEQNEELMQRRLKHDGIDVSLHKILVVGVIKVRLWVLLVHPNVTIYCPPGSSNYTGFSVQQGFNCRVDLALGDVMWWGSVALEPDPHLKNDQDSCHVKSELRQCCKHFF